MDKQYNWESYRVDVKSYFDKYPSQRSRMEESAHYTVSPVLEVGACDGFISWLIKGQKKEVVASDISRNSCRVAHKKGLDVVCCDARHLPFKDNSFHTVMATELLEHLQNMGKALEEIQRVSLKRVIISLPLQNWAGDITHRWDINITNITHKGEKVRSGDKIDDIVLILDKKTPAFLQE